MVSCSKLWWSMTSIAFKTLNSATFFVYEDVDSKGWSIFRFLLLKFCPRSDNKTFEDAEMWALQSHKAQISTTVRRKLAILMDICWTNAPLYQVQGYSGRLGSNFTQVQGSTTRSFSPNRYSWKLQGKKPIQHAADCFHCSFCLLWSPTRCFSSPKTHQPTVFSSWLDLMFPPKNDVAANGWKNLLLSDNDWYISNPYECNKAYETVLSEIE